MSEKERQVPDSVSTPPELHGRPKKEKGQEQHSRNTDRSAKIQEDVV
jgi:hypothetical protein